MNQNINSNNNNIMSTSTNSSNVPHLTRPLGQSLKRRPITTTLETCPSSRMAQVPVNRISSHPSLGSFSSLDLSVGSGNILSSSSRSFSKSLMLKNRTNNISSQNESWKISPASLSTTTHNNRNILKSNTSNVLRSAQTSAAIEAITAARIKFLQASSSKLSNTGGITLSKGLQWNSKKRPVVTISSSNTKSQSTSNQGEEPPPGGGVNTKKPKLGANSKVVSQRKSVEGTLQAQFESILASSGYSTKTFCALETGYHCKPTELQKSSYGLRLVQAIRASDKGYVDNLLKCGISTNPCNMFGESIVHMVCRRADYELLKVFIDHGCSVQVSDDFGRTPLHDACWTAEPCFKCVELLLDRDLRLLNIRDCRGFTPLDYVKRENWTKWIDFFHRKKEVYWAKRSIEKLGEEEPPKLVHIKPNSNPLKDPKNAISTDLAKMLASGAVSPHDILLEKQKDHSPNDASTHSTVVCT